MKSYFALAVADEHGVMVPCDTHEEAEAEKERMKMSDARRVAVTNSKVTEVTARLWLESRGASRIIIRSAGQFQF